jgi:predicted RNA-binding Zn-ribbon protein involved in translation (DUF1610 family)
MFESEFHFAGDYSRDLLRNGIIEFKAGNRVVARRYIDRALYMSSDQQVLAEGWYWMSQLEDQAAAKRRALENCLALDLQHARARRALAILDGKLKPEEIVDPDAPVPGSRGPQAASVQRFMCPRCGGRMSFSPDGQSLLCEYCQRSEALNPRNAAAGENDFIVAMATARGHGQPLAEQVFHCQGCGAEYILGPAQLSVTCAYCGSPHVVRIEAARGLLAPDGILPHAFDQQHATDILVGWVGSLKIEPERQVVRPRGLYVPLWTFDLGGSIDYTAEMLADVGDGAAGHAPRMVRKSDRYPVMVNHIPIPASRKPSAPFVRLIASFELERVQPYDPGYLADWPAELYDVPMADASLDAREQTFARLKADLPNRLPMARLISASSANLSIESFRLELLPVWVTEVWCEGRSGLVLINGQNGTVQGDVVPKQDRAKDGLKDWLEDLIGE